MEWIFAAGKAQQEYPRNALPDHWQLRELAALGMVDAPRLGNASPRWGGWWRAHLLEKLSWSHWQGLAACRENHRIIHRAWCHGCVWLVPMPLLRLQGPWLAAGLAVGEAGAGQRSGGSSWLQGARGQPGATVAGGAARGAVGLGELCARCG